MIVTYHYYCDICKKHFADDKVYWNVEGCDTEENAGGLCPECFNKIQTGEIVVNGFGEWHYL